MKSLSDGALEHVRHLAVEIGSRPIGSPANRAAARYISGVFEDAGLALELQEISCPDWVAGHAYLAVDGEQLEAVANTFSPSCDILAETRPVCTMAELERARLFGAIPVFYGDLAQGELAPTGGIYVSDRDRRILQLLEERQPAGIITVNPVLNARWRLIEDFDLGIPSLTVPAHEGLRLLKRAGAAVHMKIGARRTPATTANVIGRLPGVLPDRIVFCAHYDTKVDTPGACDNAAGVGVLLILAQILAQQQHRHTLEWVAFTGEEGAGLGDMAYAEATRTNGQPFEDVTAAINIDGIGPFTGTTTVASFACSPAFESLLEHSMSRFPGMIRVEPWPASDHYIFYSHGAPSIALSSRGIRNIFHTPADTLEWISAEKLAEAAQLVLDVTTALDGRERAWTRPAA